MNMKPILFNTEMVRAILDSRKTVTRRVVKPQSKYRLRIRDKRCHKGGWHEYSENPMADKFCNHPWGAQYTPPCRPGDILYVRETWYYESHMEDMTKGEPDLPSGRYSHRYIFKADYRRRKAWLNVTHVKAVATIAAAEAQTG